MKDFLPPNRFTTAINPFTSIIKTTSIYGHRYSVRFSCQALQQYKRQSGELELIVFWHDVIFIFPLYHALGFEILKRGWFLAKGNKGQQQSLRNIYIIFFSGYRPE